MLKLPQKIALISHASKLMLKILQARLQQYMNHELPDVQSGFRKGRGTRDQIANICWIIKKARELQKNIYFCFIDYAKAIDCVYWGPAPVGSRESLRMTASVIRKVKGERKRLDLPWFTQKDNKAPDTELALFTEAADALSVG